MINGTSQPQVEGPTLGGHQSQALDSSPEDAATTLVADSFRERVLPLGACLFYFSGIMSPFWCHANPFRGSILYFSYPLYSYSSNYHLPTSNVIKYCLSISFHQCSIYRAPTVYIRCEDEVDSEACTITGKDRECLEPRDFTSAQIPLLLV